MEVNIPVITPEKKEHLKKLVEQFFADKNNFQYEHSIFYGEVVAASVAAGKITLTDFPPEVQEELKVEDWESQYDSDVPNIFDSWVSGKDWTECLERTFIRLELLKLGYEMCWECEDYREDHRKFFEQYFKEKEELFGRR